MKRMASAVRDCACGCGDLARWGHRYRRGHNERRPDGVWARDEGSASERLAAPVAPEDATRHRDGLAAELARPERSAA